MQIVDDVICSPGTHYESDNEVWCGTPGRVSAFGDELSNVMI